MQWQVQHLKKVLELVKGDRMFEKVCNTAIANHSASIRKFHEKLSAIVGVINVGKMP